MKERREQGRGEWLHNTGRGRRRRVVCNNKEAEHPFPPLFPYVTVRFTKLNGGCIIKRSNVTLWYYFPSGEWKTARHRFQFSRVQKLRTVGRFPSLAIEPRRLFPCHSSYERRALWNHSGEILIKYIFRRASLLSRVDENRSNNEWT